MKKIYVVGIGPGEYDSMTIKAERILKACDVIVGYTVYVNLAKEYFPGKEFLTTPMRQEKERCVLAFEEAMKEKTVAVVCSGDAGIYGMAGLMLEIGQEYPKVLLEIVPGITAASSGAAVLGAPLMHDFAVVSLSDLLTPWGKIEGRLRAASQADFSLCIYNPSSKKRAGYLKRACEIMMEYKEPDTVCGVVKNIGREGEEKKILTLKELADYEADMFTTVFVGNSQTMDTGCGRWMVTPRGYRL
ncbi:precorrin-3B C(17)-methyltransferase [Lachnospiraceae bacterium 45-P1]